MERSEKGDFMRTIILFLIFFIIIVLQTAIAPYFQIYGIYPDFILITVVCIGLIMGQRTGSVFGFFSGLFADFFHSTPLGLDAFCKCIIGFLSGMIGKFVIGRSILILAFSIFIFTFINYFIYVFFIFLLGEKYPMGIILLKLIAPQALYNSIFSVLLFPIIKSIIPQKKEAEISVRP